MKTSIFLDNQKLLDYFISNKDRSLTNNRSADPALVAKAVEGLKDIFTAKDFHRYIPFIGNARKIKRLINTVLLLEVEKTDFETTDFDKQDLVLLLLIYINYPNVFRKIHNTETQGKDGFFSVVYDFDTKKYKNSDEYKAYIDDGLSENQKFILNKLFCVEEKFNAGGRPSEITKEMETSYACFNGGVWNSGGRNLEQYVNLITRMSRPVTTSQYRFYVNAIRSILSGKDIVEVLTQDEFAVEDGEAAHEQLWRVLVNTPNEEHVPEKSREILQHALQSVPGYSLLEAEGVGNLRDTMSYFIVRLLDQIGWTDERGRHSGQNYDENVVKINDWIFGENTHVGMGVLDILGNDDRGITGIYDLLLFRLRCCMDRGGDIYNVSRALLKHDSQNASAQDQRNQGIVEEMRELSQRIFEIFKLRYIVKGKNIFEEIDKLTLEGVCGNYLGYVNGKVESGKIENVEDMLAAVKARLNAFIVYQFGNKVIDHGIGCGYYDEDGTEDRGGIYEALNDYWFGSCFNPENNENAYEYFLDFLLSVFRRRVARDDISEWIPHIGEWTRFLDKEHLANYWRENKQEILAHKFDMKNRRVVTVNYVANYSRDLEGVYHVLDELMRENVLATDVPLI